ncbi:MAG: Calcium-transporting ATPase 1 [bacterium ADurb.Bin374]|nr:MAG: Calcium-transporting ATPase 1 [bacterium ADurb.Bin374]
MNVPPPFDPANIRGLSSEEVLESLERWGPNELPLAKKRGLLDIAAEVVREPMFLLLIFCGALYLVLGDIEEALMLLGFVFVIMGITFYQEQRTENALEALRNLSSPRALVIRNGAQERIAGRDVVQGDIVLLSEGDRVPADGVILHSVNLSTDESLLTGESVPVRKRADVSATDMGQPGGDDTPFVFSGSMVVKGQGIARIIHTGVRTSMGKIGKALQSLAPEQTRLQRETGRIVRNFGIVGAVSCVIVVVVYGLTHGDWIQGFLAGLTLAMATLPEEFPVVLTIFLALGAWRMSHRNVLTRRVPAVETLGSATVLCTDKTGTLTQNRMTVTHLSTDSSIHVVEHGADSLPESFHELVEFSILASPVDPFDPMEKAMCELGKKTLDKTEHLHRDWTLVREYPLSEQLLAMSRVWRSPSGDTLILAAKGAPEAIADLCHLPEADLEVLRGQINTLADQGLRVIGVARGTFSEKELPDGQHDLTFEFLGLLGLADPVRPEVPAAVAECLTAGVRVIMITGDYPGTARSIARQIGLVNPEDVISGPELDAMDDAALQSRIRNISIFARAVPEQKLRLVQALKANGDVVAMTGDGVNDAPALKAAHIGVAMGGRGTDVAREASSLVLLDDDFTSIVQAVRLGRRIFDNLRKAMSFIVAVHIPIAGLSLLPVLLKWPLLLLPVHVVFLELFIDPACSIVFEAEAEEPNIMSRPPRTENEPLFDRSTVVHSILQGASILALSLIAYVVVSGVSRSVDEARAACFITLVMGNFGLILSNRCLQKNFISALGQPNKALWWVLGGTGIALVLCLSLPFLKSLFKFGSLHLTDLAVAFGAGCLAIVLSELIKLFFHSKREPAVG